MTKNVNLLIDCHDPSGGAQSVKAKRAIAKGVEVWNEETFISLLQSSEL